MNSPSENDPQFTGAKAPASALAIAALLLSLLGLGIPAVICGHIALSKIKKSLGTLGGRGLALAGVILGYIGIVASVFIIAFVLIPTINGVSEKAGKASAMNSAYNLKSAISAYFTEYRKYPAEKGGDENDVIFSDHKLMDILLASDSSTLNPRRIPFFSSKAAKAMGDGKYRSGVLLDENGGGELWDPWGNHYRIRLDLDYNGRIERPAWDRENGADHLPQSILVWSPGKDGIEGTKDDIKTW